MGIAEAISGEHLYLDTNVFIYAVEGFSGLEDELRRLFSAVDAGRITATTTLKLPDAIHLATAQSAGCDTLVTNDPDFRNAADMRVVMLSGLNREEAE